VSWLRRLFERDPQLDPEDYARVRCDACDGTGLPLRSRRDSWGSMPFVDRRGDPHCVKCYGKGYIMVKRKPEVPREAPEAGRDAATHAATTVAETASEAPLPPPEPPDTVSPPTAPEAPEGFVTQ
jgi:hypothetical protein